MYKGILGMQGYTGYTRVNWVYKVYRGMTVYYSYMKEIGMIWRKRNMKE